MYEYANRVSGTGQAANSTAEEVTLIAAPGAGKRIYVQKLFIGVILAATGGGGITAIEDGSGGTRIVEISSAAVGVYVVNFGEPGYPLSLNTLLNLTVDGATTNEATARVTVTGIVM